MIEFLEDIICTSTLLPSEHRASSQLLRMLTKEEPTQTPKINLGTLLTSLQVSEKENDFKFATTVNCLFINDLSVG